MTKDDGNVFGANVQDNSLAPLNLIIGSFNRKKLYLNLTNLASEPSQVRLTTFLR